MPFIGMYAPLEGSNLQVPKLQHYYRLNHLHYLTHSTYRRVHPYDSERLRNQWLVTLGDLRRELGFKIVGYVLMPDTGGTRAWHGRLGRGRARAGRARGTAVSAVGAHGREARVARPSWP
jgi:hypothetical protein